MVGELEVEIADQKMLAEFHGDQIVLRFDSFRSARSIAKYSLPYAGSIGKMFDFTSLRLHAQIADYRPIMLFPKPSWIVKRFSKQIRDMIAAVDG